MNPLNITPPKSYSLQSLLSWAAASGHTELIRDAIKKGGNINEKDRDGWTPLMEAAVNGHAETVQFLIENGANIHAKNYENLTTLDLAQQTFHHEVAEKIRRYIEKE